MTPSSRWLAPLRALLLGGALGGAACVLPPEVPSALSVLLVLVVPVALWLAVASPREEARELLLLFLGAVAVRLAVALTIHYGLPAHAFSMDQAAYQRYGFELAEHWAGRAPGPDHLGDKAGYYVWNALVYTLVGYLPLAATLPNAAVAGVSAVLAYKMAGDLAGRRAARLAGGFAALFPSLVLWSSLNLKDAAAMATILLALRGAQRLQRGFSPAGLLMVAAGIAGLSQLRNYLVALLALSVALSWLLPRLRAASLPATIGIWAVLALGLALHPGPVESLAEQASFESLETSRRNLALGASAYHGDADISTPTAALRFLPVGLAYFLLAPAPWQLFNARQWLTLPEMLMWYALLPQVFFGWRYLLRARVGAALPIGTFAVLGTLSYALVESNLGTAYRHRAQVLVLFLIFAAVGIATRRERREIAARPLTEVLAT